MIKRFCIWYLNSFHVLNMEKSYWKGRLDGWQACENMVLKRAVETNVCKDRTEAFIKLVQ